MGLIQAPNGLVYRYDDAGEAGVRLLTTNFTRAFWIILTAGRFTTPVSPIDFAALAWIAE
jgi:hypothetical protein